MGARGAALTRRQDAIDLLSEAFDEAPQHVEVVVEACGVLGVDWRDVLDELDAIRPLYLWGNIVGFAGRN